MQNMKAAQELRNEPVDTRCSASLSGKPEALAEGKFTDKYSSYNAWVYGEELADELQEIVCEYYNWLSSCWSKNEEFDNEWYKKGLKEVMPRVLNAIEKLKSINRLTVFERCDFVNDFNKIISAYNIAFDTDYEELRDFSFARYEEIVHAERMKDMEKHPENYSDAARNFEASASEEDAPW